MKKIVLLFLSWLFTSILVKAQTPVFQWAKDIGSTYNSYVNDIVVDGLGNVYTTGYFYGGVDFDPGVGVSKLYAVYNGGNDVFISKLDSLGNFVWARSMGGGMDNKGHSIAVDKSGNVYTIGDFMGTVDFDPGAGTFNLTSGTNYDVFISKLDASGNFVWAKQFLGPSFPSYNNGASIAIDESGHVYTTGFFQVITDFDPGAATFNLTPANGNIFVSKLDSLGNFVWAKNMGKGSSSSEGVSIALDKNANIYTAGFFNSTADFDPSAATFNLSSAGSNDIFISKLDSSGNFIWAKRFGGTLDDKVNAIAVDGSGHVYTTGAFSGTADFDCGAGTYNLIDTSSAYKDIFISKLDASGNFIWAKQLQGNNSDHQAYSLALDKTGSVYTTGYFQGMMDFDPGIGIFNLTAVPGNPDAFISKLDSSGSFLWTVQLSGTYFEYCKTITTDTKGHVYTAGGFQGTTDFDPGVGTYNVHAFGNADIFIHKIGGQATGSITTSLTKETNNNTNEIIIYPNPNNGEFNILIPRVDDNTTIEIYNSIGILVYTKKIYATDINIFRLTNQANGLYFVKLVTDNKMIGTWEIIKE